MNCASISKRRESAILRKIQYFQAVVRCGSFTEAAVQCHISQSAISQQIQTLEQFLGVQLLKRGNRKFSVTPAGEHFYQKSLLLTADFEKLCRETAQIAHTDTPQLHIGCLKDYGGTEFHLAVADFSTQYPNISVQIQTGNHEDLYDALRRGKIDLVLNDQRRAFSDEYVNLILTTRAYYIEFSQNSSIPKLESIEVGQLREYTCILISSPEQQENESAYYREVVGIQSDFLFAENLEEARLLVIGGRGFLPVESERQSMQFGTTLHRIPLTRSGKPIQRNYCAFWKAEQANPYVAKFAAILQSKFTSH